MSGIEVNELDTAPGNPRRIEILEDPEGEWMEFIEMDRDLKFQWETLPSDPDEWNTADVETADAILQAIFGGDS